MEFSVTSFTPWSALIGGALIGLASGLLLLFNGRIAGISGIAAGTLTRNVAEAGWRLLFIIGLLLGALLYPLLTGEPIAVDPQVGLPLTFVGGFLVGFGTRMASGCTAGHGISGIARLSLRSAVATATFFITAMATTTVFRSLVG